MLPTASRDKIPKAFVYPLTAKALSEALADAPQGESLKLRFGVGPNGLKPDSAGLWDVLVIHFFRYEHHPSGWQFSVRPVPKVLAGRVTELLHGEGMDRVHLWLVAQRDPVWYDTSQGITVTYSVTEDRLLITEHRRG